MRNILLCCIMSQSISLSFLKAQEIQERPPRKEKELLFSYGIAPFPVFFHMEDKTSPNGGIFSFQDPNIRTYNFIEQGSYSFGISWKKRKKRFRLLINHVRLKIEETFFGGEQQEEKHRYTSILCDWTRTWWERKHMELYSGGGIGLGINEVSFDRDVFEETRLHLPFNITAVGFRYNFQKLSGFLDLGWGDLGIVTTGLTLPINPKK